MEVLTMKGNVFYLDAGSREFRYLFHGDGIRVNPEEGTSILIEGTAGVGKTTVALQLATQAIRKNKNLKCLYYSFDQTGQEIENLIRSYQFLIKAKIYRWEDQAAIQFNEQFNIIEAINRDADVNRTLDAIRRHVGFLKGQDQEQSNIIVLDSIGAIEELVEFERKHVSRLVDEMKQFMAILILVRERYESGLVATSEYLTNVVIELKKQYSPENEMIGISVPTTVIEIKKTRNQPSFRGPHEFEIKGGRNYAKSSGKRKGKSSVSNHEDNMGGFFVYSSLKTVEANSFRDDECVNNTARACFGLPELDKGLSAKKEEAGILYGQSILLKGPPGNYKTDLGIQFLKQAFVSPQGEKQRVLFISFKIDKAALQRIQIFENEEEKEKFLENLEFIDARLPFKTPAMIMASIRKTIEREITGNKMHPIKRAVIFGVGMLEILPMFQKNPLPFLQVLLNYFSCRGISSILIDWPQPDEERTHSFVRPTVFVRDLVSAALSLKKIERKITGDEDKSIYYECHTSSAIESGYCPKAIDCKKPLCPIVSSLSIERRDYHFVDLEIGQLLGTNNKLIIRNSRIDGKIG